MKPDPLEQFHVTYKSGNDRRLHQNMTLHNDV